MGMRSGLSCFSSKEYRSSGVFRYATSCDKVTIDVRRWIAKRHPPLGRIVPQCHLAPSDGSKGEEVAVSACDHHVYQSGHDVSMPNIFRIDPRNPAVRASRMNRFEMTVYSV